MTHENDLWVAVVDGLPAGMNSATDVERFADLDAEVRDLIAGLLDVGRHSFDVDWRFADGARVSAGQMRALRRLSATLSRWRCPACLSDVRHPSVGPGGVECPLCAHVDGRRAVRFTRRPTRAGYTWTASLDEADR
ncbi:hypothetical protein [Pseudonocardia sp. D17]|uniref:hypothetical protein n=1 Tax=Pseudonocardia sp. D17 TaxID=882661 RepID=UPI0030CAD6A7